MATPGNGDPHSEERSQTAVLRRQRVTHEALAMFELLRKRVRTITTQSAVPVSSSQIAQKVVLQKDLLQLVGSPTLTDECEVTVDADGGIRIYYTPGTGGGGGAPTNAEYLVGALSGGLSAERLVTNTATITWDLATAGQAKANVPNDSIDTAKLGGDITSAGKALLDDADAAAQRTTLGLAAVASSGSATDLTTGTLNNARLDATLAALAGLDGTAGLLEQTGVDTFVKRALGVAAGTSIPTRADADTRYAAASHSHIPGDVTGLAAIATSGSASDLTAGTVPLARLSGITDAEIAAGSKDAAAGTPSLRTLGTGAQQAAAGNHTHAQLHDAATVADTTTINLSISGQQISGDTIQQMSITADGSGLKLVNDETSPGANRVYGTNGAGTKGWKADPGGGSFALTSSSIAFTDGETRKRVTVSSGSVVSTDKIQVSIRRPNTAESADTGHIYLANVVQVIDGQFDVVVLALDYSGQDATESPPSETIELVWSRST